MTYSAPAEDDELTRRKYAAVIGALDVADLKRRTWLKSTAKNNTKRADFLESPPDGIAVPYATLLLTGRVPDSYRNPA